MRDTTCVFCQRSTAGDCGGHPQIQFAGQQPPLRFGWVPPAAPPSLWDQYAMVALGRLVTAALLGTRRTPGWIANEAAEIADAMLNERDKRWKAGGTP